MAKLIAYFSRAGENYFNGSIRSIPVGNTEIAAKKLQDIIGADLFKIEPLHPYSDDYKECVAQARDEMQSDARPELKAYPESWMIMIPFIWDIPATAEPCPCRYLRFWSATILPERP